MLLSTHNIIGSEIRKIIFNYTILSGGLNVAVYGFPGKS